jgi:hypothetical protein
VFHLGRPRDQARTANVRPYPIVLSHTSSRLQYTDPFKILGFDEGASQVIVNPQLHRALDPVGDGDRAVRPTTMSVNKQIVAMHLSSRKTDLGFRREIKPKKIDVSATR